MRRDMSTMAHNVNELRVIYEYMMYVYELCVTRGHKNRIICDVNVCNKLPKQ